MKHLKSYKIFESNDIEYIFKELTLQLKDAGLYVDMGYDGNKYIIFIEDRYKVFCKDYPMDDMDWLYSKNIISEFIEDIEHHGIKRDIDYKLYVGGTIVRLVFDRKEIDKINIFNESINTHFAKNAPLINAKINLLKDISLELSDLGLEIEIWSGTFRDVQYDKYINMIIKDEYCVLDKEECYFKKDLYNFPEIIEFEERLKSFGIMYRERSAGSDLVQYHFDKQGKINKTDLLRGYL